MIFTLLYLTLLVGFVAFGYGYIYRRGHRIVNRKVVRFKRGYNKLVSNKDLPPLYKIVSAIDGSPINGGWGSWDQPDDDGPGEWRFEKNVEPCHSGLHLTDKRNAESWCLVGRALAIYRVEVDGPAIMASEKWVAARVRLLYPVYTGRYSIYDGPNIIRAIEDGEQLRADEQQWADRPSKEDTNG